MLDKKSKGDFEGGSFLITTDDFFRAPNGKQYNAVFGKCSILNSEEVLGIKTNARSTNWFVKVGEGDKCVYIAGCQIHYAVKAELKDINTSKYYGWDLHEGKVVTDSRPCGIYFPDGI